MWDLPTIQSKTRELWEELHKLNDCYFDPTEDSFLTEIKSYGNLELIETWQRAYASLKASFIAIGCLEDGQYLIEFYLLHASKKWGWRDLLPLVIAQLFLIPEAVEAIASGLRTLTQYGSEYGTDRQDLEQLQELIYEQHPELRRLEPRPTAVLAGDAS
jgi:hypothetical protein